MLTRVLSYYKVEGPQSILLLVTMLPPSVCSSLTSPDSGVVEFSLYLFSYLCSAHFSGLGAFDFLAFWHHAFWQHLYCDDFHISGKKSTSHAAAWPFAKCCAQYLPESSLSPPQVLPESSLSPSSSPGKNMFLAPFSREETDSVRFKFLSRLSELVNANAEV